MLTGIVWAVVLFPTKSTAIHVSNQSSQRDLDKFGNSHYELVNNAFESVRKDFNQTDQAEITKQAFIQTLVSFPKSIGCSTQNVMLKF